MNFATICIAMIFAFASYAQSTPIQPAAKNLIIDSKDTIISAKTKDLFLKIDQIQKVREELRVIVLKASFNRYKPKMGSSWPPKLEKEVQEITDKLVIEWQKNFQKQFTDKEIDYLIQYYSHPISKKVVNFQREENNPKLWSKIIETNFKN